MALAISVCSEINAHIDVAACRELEGIGDQVFEDLLETFRIALHRVRQPLGKVNVEGQVLGLGNVAEAAVYCITQRGKGYVLDLHGDGAGLDFREIEDVVDEIEEIGAGRVYIAGELNLLLGERARIQRAAG